MRSWEGDNCRDGGSCGWALPTTTSAPCLRARGSSGHHLLRRLLPSGFGSPDSAACAPVGFDLDEGLGDELASIAFVVSQFAVSIDLPFEKVEDSRTRSEGFVILVASTRE